VGNLLPNADYLGGILIGARENDLPAAYIEKLTKIKTSA
jgi:hypothetical protein